MTSKLAFCVFLLTISCCVAQEFYWRLQPLGCYKDDPHDRALPVLYKNLRSKINWFNMEETLMACADIARKLGYDIFGIQFYGECWGTKSKSSEFERHGKTTECWRGVGKDYTFFAYKNIREQIPS